MKYLFILLLSTCCFAINPRTSWTSGEFRDSLQIDSLKSAPVVGTDAHGKFIVGTVTVPDSFANTAIKSHRGWFDSIYVYAIYGLDSLRINHGVVISGDLYAGGNVRLANYGAGYLQTSSTGVVSSTPITTINPGDANNLTLQAQNAIYLQSRFNPADSWHDMLVTNLTGTTINTYLYCPAKLYADTASFRTIGSLVKTDSINATKGIKAPVFTGYLKGFGDSTAKVPDTVAFRLGISANTFQARSLGLGIGHFDAVGNLTSSNLTAAEMAASVNGTADYLSKFTSQYVIGNSPMRTDAGNTWVSIGGTSPTSPFDIRAANIAITGTATGLLNVMTTDVGGINIGGTITLGGSNSITTVAPRVFGAIAGLKETAVTESKGYLAFFTNLSATLGERMRITSNGLIGIGTSAPNATLTVKGNFSDTGTVYISTLGTGTVMATSGVLSSVSDERKKKIKGNFIRSIDAIMPIQPIIYNWNKISGLDTTVTMAGFSAQNVQKSIPEAVSQDRNGFLSLSDRALLATAINAIREQQSEIQELKNQVRILIDNAPVPTIKNNWR